MTPQHKTELITMMVTTGLVVVITILVIATGMSELKGVTP